MNTICTAGHMTSIVNDRALIDNLRCVSANKLSNKTTCHVLYVQSNKMKLGNDVILVTGACVLSLNQSL